LCREIREPDVRHPEKTTHVRPRGLAAGGGNSGRDRNIGCGFTFLDFDQLILSSWKACENDQSVGSRNDLGAV
jgi:hypothetical protein